MKSTGLEYPVVVNARVDIPTFEWMQRRAKEVRLSASALVRQCIEEAAQRDLTEKGE